MFNQRKNLLSVLILLIFVFLLEVVAFYESKILTRICEFPLLAPVITIIIVPALAFIIGVKCGEISTPEIRNTLFQDKNKLVKRIFNVLIIIFCLMGAYVGVITIGRLLIDTCGMEIVVLQDLSNYCGLFINLYYFTHTEFYAFAIILITTLGFIKTLILKNN